MIVDRSTAARLLVWHFHPPQYQRYVCYSYGCAVDETACYSVRGMSAIAAGVALTTCQYQRYVCHSCWCGFDHLSVSEVCLP